MWCLAERSSTRGLREGVLPSPARISSLLKVIASRDAASPPCLEHDSKKACSAFELNKRGGLPGDLAQAAGWSATAFPPDPSRSGKQQKVEARLIRRRSVHDWRARHRARFNRPCHRRLSLALTSSVAAPLREIARHLIRANAANFGGIFPPAAMRREPPT